MKLDIINYLQMLFLNSSEGLIIQHNLLYDYQICYLNLVIVTEDICILFSNLKDKYVDKFNVILKQCQNVNAD